jgi:endonuclease/exonuclease/phosphatase family metal-dependent hydrolase
MRTIRSVHAVVLAMVLAFTGTATSGALLPAGVVGSAEAAAAALSTPVIKVVYGDRTVTVGWKKVTGALGYTAQLSRSSSFSSPTTISTATRLSAVFPSLINGAKYYVRVIARDSATSVRSVVKTAVPDDGYPVEIGEVRVTSAGDHAIKVSWAGGGRATRVGIIAGADSTTESYHFDSGWYPATTRSILLTVPAKWRDVLGTGSGNPIYVKVAQTNSRASKPALSRTFSLQDSYRLTPAGMFALAGLRAPAADTSALKVAEYNVLSVNASAKVAGHTWRDRRKTVATNIAASGADLVGLEELATGWTGVPGSSPRQWEDMAALLASPAYGGYAIANTTANLYAKASADYPGTVSSHLFYDPTVLDVLDSGYISPRTDLGLASIWPAGEADRYIAWAHLRMTSSGRTFYAASAHFLTGAGASKDALRTAEATALSDYLDRLAGDSTIVLLADLNSSFARTRNAPSTVFVADGYYDAAATARRSGSRYSTENSSNQTSGVSGFPTRPYRHKYVSSRIDYIMVKGSPGAKSYANQLHLTADGTFDANYQGSDHNIQYAIIGIR